MDQNWKNFLTAEHAAFKDGGDIAFPAISPDSGKHIFAISELAVLTVAGKDAAKFLQGQITCNINDITETQSSVGALCNPKGRVITTFLLIKKVDAFLLVLPKTLLGSVKERLQKYILRSDVQLIDGSDELCLIGLNCPTGQPNNLSLPEQLFATSQQNAVFINISPEQSRYLVISEPETAIMLWKTWTGDQGFQPESSAQWRYLDITAGFPWLTPETSEEFIPQMLNLDKLGGISFNKGCYTGQEIVARTHYLGKTKREMFLAECASATAPQPNTAIMDKNAESEQSLGTVLTAQARNNVYKMLIVLQVSDANTYSLVLNNQDQDKVTALTL